MEDKEKLIEQAANEIRSSDALVIIGAGASFRAGMPLAGQLAPLVWHTLDKFPKALEGVCKELGIPTMSAKKSVGDDWDRILESFKVIGGNLNVQHAFKDAIVNLDETRSLKFSKAHDALSRLLFTKNIIGVVSLNWDTLLEKSFQRRYGALPSCRRLKLWKPHGDCNYPEKEWILLHQPGVVPEDLKKFVKSLVNERPRSLIIIGYSESDEVILNELVSPLSNRWKVFRISPSASGEGAIPIDAGDAMNMIANKLTPLSDVEGWKFVSFSNQRGIEGAISGERLGPRDVESCPHLPHFEAALKELEMLHTVHISGDSGCGKSITAWQLAHNYNKKGWLVIEPEYETASSIQECINAVSSLAWSVIVVIDDSQTYSRDLVQGIVNNSSDELKVVVTTTDIEWNTSGSIRISLTATVRRLSENFTFRKNEILPIIQKFDSHVGEGFTDLRIERRIKEAAKAKTPWEFSYILRGGWKQTRKILETTLDFNQANILLTAIAIRQLISLDSGIKIENLSKDISFSGRDEVWIQRSLKLLEEKKFVIKNDTIRCLHLKSAAAIVSCAFNSLDLKREVYDEQMIIIRRCIQDNEASLQGVYWLLQQLRDSQRDILLPEVVEYLVSRCFNSHSEKDKRDAGNIISHLIGWRVLSCSKIIASYEPLIVQWITKVDHLDAYGVGQIINSMWNSNREAGQDLVEKVEPKQIAEKFQFLNTEQASSRGYFLERLGLARESWKKLVIEQVDKEGFKEKILQFNSANLWRLSGIIQSVASYDFDFALECVDHTIEIYQSAFSSDPLKAYLNLKDLEYWVLCHKMLSPAKPSKRQKLIMKSMFQAIKEEQIANEIVVCRYGDWENYSRLLGWIKEVHTPKLRQIQSAIDWDQLSECIGDRWSCPPRELRLLLASLATGLDCEPVKTIINKNSAKIKTMDPILAYLCPEAAVSVLRNGNVVNLAAHNSSSWGIQVAAIVRIIEIDESLTEALLQQNVEHFLDSIKNLSLPDGFPLMFDLLCELDKLFVEKLLKQITPDAVEDLWNKALQDHRKKERLAARKILRMIEPIAERELSSFVSVLLRKVRYRNPKNAV